MPKAVTETFIAATILIASAAPGFPAMALQDNKTTLEGVYTQAQAGRGETIFEQVCGGCHQQPNLSNADAAPLRGNRFLERWRDDNLMNLFTTMRTTMPRGAGGNPNDRGSTARLKDNEYIDILSFILQANGFPPGTLELTLERLERTQLVGHSGPRELPDLATVRVVGCLSPGPSGGWMLTNAAPPARTIMPAESVPEELKDAEKQAPGKESFRLQNFEYAAISIDPNAYKGYRVLVKGVLRRQPKPPDRINVLSMQQTATDCSTMKD
jgi:mono/diheme cytochrome c family protein